MALIFIVSSSAAYAEETICGKDVKAEVAKMLSVAFSKPEEKKLAMQAELYKKYQYCADDNMQQQVAGVVVFDSFSRAARRCGARVSNRGSLYFEEMSCCGYDPQRRQFACPVTIKQSFGFGAAPLPGSREYVLHCVKQGKVWFPVGRDSVHLANEMLGKRPNWQFAVIANANQNLQRIYPMNGKTRKARSILSWGFEPTSCDFKPIWGNALTYRIRLDQ